MRSKKNEKKCHVEGLEAEIVTLRKYLEEKYQQLKQVKSTISLDSFLENQWSPLDRYVLGFQKGESSLYARNNNKAVQKIPITNNNRKGGNN